MLHTPFYDPEKTYEENFKEGPFGAFTGGEGNLIDTEKRTDQPRFNFLGFKVNSPFGIPAGPLLNSNFCKGAFDNGFDICVFKTVRSAVFPCHPYPNVLAVHIEGDLTFQKAQGKLMADTNYFPPISITNSFGVPSRAPEVWQEDVKKAIYCAKEGQVLVLSFMGTVRENQTADEFVSDYALAARQAIETGAKVLETNLSCPNIGSEGLVCYDLDMTERVCKAIRAEIGGTPLILKVGYYKNDEDIKKLAEIVDKYAQAVSLINTIQVEVVDKEGKQALPGGNRPPSCVF